MKFSLIQIVQIVLAFITSNFRYLRMSPERFEHLLTLVGPLRRRLLKWENHFCCRMLTVTLHMLAGGDDQQSLAFSHRFCRTTVNHILWKTCSAIWKALRDIYVRPPSSPDDWREISRGFEDLWNLPHCVGAIDGKHVNMKCPNNSPCSKRVGDWVRIGTTKHLWIV